jgi:hypothetical protein
LTPKIKILHPVYIAHLAKEGRKKKEKKRLQETENINILIDLPWHDIDCGKDTYSTAQATT